MPTAPQQSRSRCSEAVLYGIEILALRHVIVATLFTLFVTLCTAKRQSDQFGHFVTLSSNPDKTFYLTRNVLLQPDAGKRTEARMEKSTDQIKNPNAYSFPDLDAHSAPFHHNPSAWSQRIPIAVISLFGVVISTYMGLYQWDLIGSVWDPVFGDQTMKVLDSDVSHKIESWVLVPDAILGAMAYLGDLLFSMAGSTRRWQYRPWLVIIFGIDVIPLGIVSAILVFMQALVVGSYCFLCLVTAVISLILVFLAYDEVWSCLKYLNGVRKKAADRGTFWRAFWGRPSETAHEVAEGMILDRSK